MATNQNSAFCALSNISDGSPFVHRAMYLLGFLCDFADLTTEQMRVTLVTAEYLKRSMGTDVWRHDIVQCISPKQNELTECKEHSASP